MRPKVNRALIYVAPFAIIIILSIVAGLAMPVFWCLVILVGIFVLIASKDFIGKRIAISSTLTIICLVALLALWPFLDRLYYQLFGGKSGLH